MLNSWKPVWKGVAMMIALGGSLTYAFGGAGTNAAVKLSNSECLDCHAEPTNYKKVNGNSVQLPVFPTNRFDQSVHAKVSCVDCHAGVREMLHAPNVPPPTCVGCHEGQPGHEAAAKDYATSIHGRSQTAGASGAAQCWDCHGSHNVLPAKDPASPVFKLNLPRTCAKCHSNPGLTKEYRMKFPEVASQYMDSMHGRALLQLGLIVAPSCNDCHGVHDIKRSVDRGSPIAHANIAKTCGQCHVKVEEVYNQSIHGQLLAKGVDNAPVCTRCHTAHAMEQPRNGHFKKASDQVCGECHQDRLKHYDETYHGKAMQLGKANAAPEVAACFDCHGHHDVLPAADPKSHLSKANILATCQKCHAGATPGFTEYQSHANPLDGEHYRALHVTFLLMTGLLVGVFAFFGGHTLAWLVRAAYLYWHDSKKFREAKVQAQEDDEMFTRFLPFDRFLHFLVVTSFLLLVITGMPLKFYYTDWAKMLFGVFGGAETARTLHRFGALVTFTYFGLHIIKLIGTAVKGRAALREPVTGKFQFRRLWKVVFGPDSMLPTFQDWKDFKAHNKWFFGRGPKPQFDRWTYWEKFDYFAVFWGVFAIGLSGLIMWFPQFFTRFLPGWIINIALIVHSDEALLAAGFIFTIHFFNTHFRLEKFPMDTVIFSGRVSKTEMLHERRRWYDRLVAEGRLEEHRARDEWERWKNIARGFGYVFFGTGLILLVLILYAMAVRLLH